MSVHYKIRAAFKKDMSNLHSGQSAGHSFWQLIQEIQNPLTGSFETLVQETLYAFPITQAVEKNASIQSNLFTISTTTISGFPKKWRIYCFDHTKNHSYHFLPEADATYIIDVHPDDNNEVQSCWTAMKTTLHETTELAIKNPHSITLSNTIRNTVYDQLAQKISSRAHSLPDFASLYLPLALPTATQHALQSNLPLNQTQTPFAHYKIKAAVLHTAVNMGSWKIHSFPFRIGHHFLVLTETSHEKETMIDSIHGLPTRYKVDCYGNTYVYTPNALETWNALLKVFSIAPDAENSAPQPRLTRGSMPLSFVSSIPHGALLSWSEPDETHTIYEGQDTLARWSQVKRLLRKLNDVEMPYSFCGLFKIIGLLKCKNCNSAYTTVLRLLGAPPHRFKGYLAPGISTTMLSEEALQNLKRQYMKVEKKFKFQSPSQALGPTITILWKDPVSNRDTGTAEKELRHAIQCFRDFLALIENPILNSKPTLGEVEIITPEQYPGGITFLVADTSQQHTWRCLVPWKQGTFNNLTHEIAGHGCFYGLLPSHHSYFTQGFNYFNQPFKEGLAELMQRPHPKVRQKSLLKDTHPFKSLQAIINIAWSPHNDESYNWAYLMMLYMKLHTLDTLKSITHAFLHDEKEKMDKRLETFANTHNHDFQKWLELVKNAPEETQVVLPSCPSQDHQVGRVQPSFNTHLLHKTHA